MSPVPLALRPSPPLLLLLRSLPHMPIPDAHPLVGRQLLQPHRAAGVELLRADGHLGAQAELPAVVEARAGVDEHRRRVDLVDEALGVAPSRSSGCCRSARCCAPGCARWPRPASPRSSRPGSAPSTRCRSRPGRRGRPAPACPRLAGWQARRAWRAARPCCRASRSAIAGRNAAATARCTSTVSSALQTLGRCTLAFSTMSTARARSALASTKMWQMPMPPVITGIVACSRQSRCSAAPPRGMIMSTYWSSRSSSVTSARSGSVIVCTAAAGDAGAAPARPGSLA